MSVNYYNYDDMKKSIMGSMFGERVAIREEWVKRTRRYVVSEGMSLKNMAIFIKNGLFDRRVEGFNQKALDEPLSQAQQWVLAYIILSEFGVPDWIRDADVDENVPEMAIAEPEEEDEAVLSALTKPAASAASTVASATTSVASATAGAAGAVVGTVSRPVQSLSDLVRGKSTEAPVEEAPVEEALVEETPTEETPTEETPTEETPVEETPVEEAASDASEEPESES